MKYQTSPNVAVDQLSIQTSLDAQTMTEILSISELSSHLREHHNGCPVM